MLKKYKEFFDIYRFDPRDKKFVWYFNQKDKPKVAFHVNEDTKEIQQVLNYQSRI